MVQREPRNHLRRSDLGAAARTLGVAVHEQVGARLIASVKAHYVRALDGAGAKGSAALPLLAF